MNPQVLLNMFMKGQFQNHPLMQTVNQMMAGKTPEQMGFAADILKDVAKMDKSLSAACYYDSERGGGSDKTY